MNPNTSKAAIKSNATTGATTLITSKPVGKKFNKNQYTNVYKHTVEITDRNQSRKQ